MVAPYIISALVFASLFALMAMGLTLTYMTTKVPNFAYGSFVTIGLYTSYTVVKVYHSNPYVGSLIAFAVSGAASVVMYLAVLRPLAKRGSPLVSQMIATFGIDIGFVGIFGIYTDYLQGVYKFIDAKQFFQLGPDFTLFGLQGIVYVAPISLSIITLGIYLLFTRTRFGVAMRASVENPPLARILGINVDVVYTFSWLLAGGLAGLAGALYTLQLPGGTSTGSNLIVEIFASSVLGGLTSIFGAAIGGLMIGSSEDLVTIWLAQGFGAVGTGIIVVLLVLIGYGTYRRRGMRNKMAGAVLAAFGIWIAVDWASGFPIDFLAGEVLNGFGPNVTPFQQAIPLLIMVITLLVLPKGIVSVNFRRLISRLKR